MTNGNQASAKLADFLQSSHDIRVNWSAKLGALLQSCKAQKWLIRTKTISYAKTASAKLFSAKLLQSSKTVYKQCIAFIEDYYTFSLSLQIGWRCPLARHCQPRHFIPFACVEEGV